MTMRVCGRLQELDKGIRDALSLSDQAIAFGGGTVSV